MEERVNNTLTTTIEFDVNVKTFNKEKVALTDAIVCGSKLTKADAGRNQEIQEDWIVVGIESNEKLEEQPKVSIQTHSKLTKADSGKEM